MKLENVLRSNSSLCQKNANSHFIEIEYRGMTASHFILASSLNLCPFNNDTSLAGRTVRYYKWHQLIIRWMLCSDSLEPVFPLNGSYSNTTKKKKKLYFLTALTMPNPTRTMKDIVCDCGSSSVMIAINVFVVFIWNMGPNTVGLKHVWFMKRCCLFHIRCCSRRYFCCCTNK